MSNNKQSSIEWLVDQLKKRGYAGEFPPHLLFEQAKEMHKQEIEDTFFEGAYGGDNISGEQYYNETFNK